MYYENSWYFEKFKLLVNISVLLTFVAVPLIVSRKKLFLAVCFEALVKSYYIFSSDSSCASIFCEVDPKIAPCCAWLKIYHALKFYISLILELVIEISKSQNLCSILQIVAILNFWWPYRTYIISHIMLSSTKLALFLLSLSSSNAK